MFLELLYIYWCTITFITYDVDAECTLYNQHDLLINSESLFVTNKGSSVPHLVSQVTLSVASHLFMCLSIHLSIYPMLAPQPRVESKESSNLVHRSDQDQGQRSPVFVGSIVQRKYHVMRIYSVKTSEVKVMRSEAVLIQLTAIETEMAK